MESLKNVSIWTEKGWKHITAREASRSHPDGGGVSYRSRLFRCELCGQYVGLTKEGANNSHFRHSQDVLSKDCPDKVKRERTIDTFHPGAHTLPLRLSYTSFSIDLAIGLLPIPDQLYSEVLHSKIRITAEGDADHPSIYNGSRVQQGRITYLSVGNPFAEKYLLDVTGASMELKNYWPQEVIGINQDGTLFDGTTKKKLPFDADVQVGHSYLLLTTREPDQCGGIVQYMVREVIKKNRRWRLYSICATVFCKETVVFFLKYHSRLTEHPVQISPLWPVFINKPYVLIHKQSPFYLLLQGQGVRTELFPGSISNLYSTSDPDRELICLQNTGRQQLLSVGRTKVLRYTYLWIDELNHTASTPEIKVFDIKGTAIEGEIQTNLPKERILVIRSQFDGMVEVRDRGKLIRRYHLKANEQTDVEVQFGYEVAAFQGLDRVLNLHFERQGKKTQYDEMTVLKKLRRCSGTKIPITHEWGSLALKYRDYPMVRHWMLERIRAGSIPKSALQILKQYQKVIEREEREA